MAVLVEGKLTFFHGQNITTPAHITFTTNFSALEVDPFATNIALDDHTCKLGSPTSSAISAGKLLLWLSGITAPRNMTLRSTTGPHGGVLNATRFSATSPAKLFPSNYEYRGFRSN